MTLTRLSEPSWYISDEDRNILQQMDKAYQHSITIQQSFWSEADIDSRFRAGDQTLWNDIYGNLPAFRKRQFNFNRIRRVCNMIQGYQRRNRKGMMFVPRESASNETAGQLTKLAYWWMDSANVYENISIAFDQMLTTGMSLLSFWPDWTTDPISGFPKVSHIAYNAFLIDPYFRNHDLSDCNYIWTRKYLSPQQAQMLYPHLQDIISKIHVRSYRDGKFQYLPESYNYGQNDLLYYDEYWYRDYRDQDLLVDIRTGETMEWRGNNENLDAFMARNKGRIELVKQKVPTTKLAAVLEGQVLYHGENPLGIDRFPFVPVLGYYDPQLPYFPWRIQGVVRGLRDAQFLYNRRKVIELDILESQINNGWKVKEDALVNPKDAFQTGQGRTLFLKQESQMTDAEQIPPPQVPPSMIQLSQLLGAEIQEIAGISDELLGMADGDQAGILSMLRQGAGLTTLQVLFDQLDQSQKYLGQLFLDFVQANFTPGKVSKIIDEEPTQEFYHRCFGRYDASVEEGPYSQNQKQMQLLQLLNLRQYIPIPTKTIIENTNLGDKQQLIEAIAEEEQQQAQSQQQQEQMQLQVLQAQIHDLQARAAANEGLGLERASRIQENKALAVERLSEAEKDRDSAVLDKAKALKELQGIDLSQLQQLLSIFEQLKGMQETKEELVETPKEEILQESTTQE